MRRATLRSLHKTSSIASAAHKPPCLHIGTSSNASLNHSVIKRNPSPTFTHLSNLLPQCESPKMNRVRNTLEVHLDIKVCYLPDIKQSMQNSTVKNCERRPDDERPCGVAVSHRSHVPPRTNVLTLDGLREAVCLLTINFT
jgi:hypothetical protein